MGRTERIDEKKGRDKIDRKVRGNMCRLMISPERGREGESGPSEG